MKQNTLNIKLTIVLLFVGITVGFAQSDAKKEGIMALDKCANLYLRLKSFQVKVEYGVFYAQHDFKVPDETNTGKIVRKGQLFYQNEAGNITLMNKKYQVLVNNSSGVISIEDRPEVFDIPRQLEVDSLEKLIEEVTVIQEDQIGYQFSFESGQLAKMDVFFTPAGYLHKMRMHYRHKMDFGQGPQQIVTQIKYYDFEKDPSLSKDFFSEKKYVQVSNGNNVKPRAKYDNYQVINRLR